MRLPSPRGYCVAFSGGCDSHVLLHALASIRQQLECRAISAIHVNHGLHPDAGDWARHCVHTCEESGIACEVIEVNVKPQTGKSTEALARDARYQAFKRAIEKNDMLLLAHHQDDQSETLMLQLLRGAGVNGLSAMPRLAEFNQGWLARPLLELTRDELLEYARQNNLAWIEDPSNQETSYDRNYLRHIVMPLLKDRWPSVSATMSRVSQHQAEAAELLEQLARQDMGPLLDKDTKSINVPVLKTLPTIQQKNVIRCWIKYICRLPVPDSVHLDRILTEVLAAQEDKEPFVQWQGAEVRRYRDTLFAQTPLAKHDPGWQSDWDYNNELKLPFGVTLIKHEMRGQGIRKQALNEKVTVRFRQGGEKCRLQGRKHHHELKKLFQDWGVPPWLRDRVPLIYLDDNLAQIVGYGLCEPFAAGPDEFGVYFKIQE